MQVPSLTAKQRNSEQRNRGKFVLTLFYFLIVVFTSNSLIAQSDSKSSLDNARSKLQFLDEISKIENRNEYFKKLNKENDKEKAPKIGLAFSGGGVRSNAFHLGLLYSLLSKEECEGTAIDCVHYLSSVSGGSWAHAFYKTSLLNGSVKGKNTKIKTAKEILEELDNYIKDSHKQDKLLLENYCSDANSPFFEKCPDYLKILLFSYEDTFDKLNSPLDSSSGITLRESWRKMIQKHFLIFGDKKISDTVKNKKIKSPYSIFNASHSAVYSFSFITKKFPKPLSLTALPFEFTEDKFGTTVDIGSKDLRWWEIFEPINYLTSHQFKGFFTEYSDKTPFFFSHIAAMSSAVLPDIRISVMENSILDLPGYEWYLKPGLNSDTIRKSYTITDGGHSDNLGILPLIERDVEFIIATDVGLDPDISLSDFKNTTYLSEILYDKTVNIFKKVQSNKLSNFTSSPIKNLKIEAEFENENDFLFSQDSGPEVLKLKDNEQQIFLGYYQNGEDDANTKKVIFYIKPSHTKLFDEFVRKDYPESYLFLKSNALNFPHTPTFKKTFSTSLIQLYFLLGKFIGNYYAVPLLKNINANRTGSLRETQNAIMESLNATY